MEKKRVWRVTGIHTNWCEEGSQVLFEAHFTIYDAAHAVYDKGEREYGLAAGYDNMRWELEGFYLDNNPHIDQMFNDVRDANFAREEMEA